MSQHLFSTSVNDKPVTVLLGWDRPLQQYFMVVEQNDADPQSESDEYLYSNLLDDKAPGQDLEYFKHKLAELGIQVPSSMFGQVRMDHWGNVGNRNCIYQIDGTFEDDVPPPAVAATAAAPAAVGELAKHFCGRELPLQVMSSRAGFYIGTCDEDGPVSRESAEYFKSRDAADEALATGRWTQKMTP